MGSLAQDSSSLTPVAFLLLVCLAFLTWSLAQRNAVLPLLIAACYMSVGQMMVIGGLHFSILRILLVVGLCRVWIRREGLGLHVTALDKLFIWWVVATLVMGTLASPSVERFVNRGGEVFNAVATYFLIRCWVRDLDGLHRVVRFLAAMIIPLALAMLVEKVTRRNFFYLLGGVAERGEVRDGTIRCQGAFRHPILAGTYAATLFPLFIGLWFSPGNRRVAIIGTACAAVATVASGSSGAVLAMMSVALGFACWQIRHHMRLFRWTLVLTVLALALSMKAPVWYLIARISELSGGTGWHRSYLIDQAVQHFSEWWMTGSTYTAHWAPSGQVLPSDPNNMDITNHYIAEGLGGGLLKLGLFLWMVVACYSIVGTVAVKAPSLPLSNRLFVWSIGVALTAHCVSFISISYFDQIVVMWYWLLASVSMLASEQRRTCQSEEEDGVGLGVFEAGARVSDQP
jgi:hypothetical protein